MDYTDVVNHYKTAAEAAKKLQVRPTALANWKARGFIPKGTQAIIQIATRGKLRADTQERR